MTAVATPETEEVVVAPALRAAAGTPPPHQNGGCFPLILAAVWLFLAVFFVCGAHL